MSENIQLVNHASIFIEEGKNFNLLTDPWYKGGAFHDAWSLLYENDDNDIQKILEKTNYIYISHEHPDHFSINFFKRYADFLKEKKIKILFQKTLDQRLENFLSKVLKLEIIILEDFKTKIILNNNITLIKCGVIDSALIVETQNNYHIILNDCDFVLSKLKKIKNILKKKKIVLYSQFSYAAYRSNDNWMKKAAEFKLKNLEFLYNFFNSNLLIPYASFVYFSSSENLNLNKYMNDTKSTSNFLDSNNIRHSFLNPELKNINLSNLMEDKIYRSKINNESIIFWDDKIKHIKPSEEKLPEENISKEFMARFLERIKKRNSIFLLFTIRFISMKYFFGNINFFISDIDEFYELNFFKITKKNFISKKDLDIELNSSRFNFLLRHEYGVDTLLTNGCFKERKTKSFEKFVRSIGFVTLNQSNEGVKISSIFSINIINRIFDMLFKLSRKES